MSQRFDFIMGRYHHPHLHGDACPPSTYTYKLRDHAPAYDHARWTIRQQLIGDNFRGQAPAELHQQPRGGDRTQLIQNLLLVGSSYKCSSTCLPGEYRDDVYV